MLLLVGCARQAQAPRSLLLITVDTCRADHLGIYGYELARTPNIDRLGERGVVYERAYAVAPETLPSHASLMTGLYPPSHGVHLNGIYHLPSSVRTLAEEFQDRGFFTGAVVASAVLGPQFGLDQGFEVYDFGAADERRADEVTKRGLELLDQAGDRPFLLWLHYYDPHSPFDPPAEFAPKGAAEESAELYDAEITAADHWIGVFLEVLEASGQGEDTLIALTADHGESLGDYGETYHSLFVYDSTIRVPLMLAGPRAPQGQRVEQPVSSIDLFSTLLGLFDLPAPATSSRPLPGILVSESQATENRERALYSESMSPFLRYRWSPLESVRTRDWLYIKAPTEELYRGDPSVPGAPNLALDSSPEARRALQGMRRALARAHHEMSPPTEGSERQLSDRERRSLEALGYLGGSSDAALNPAANSPSRESSGEPVPRADPKEMVEVSEAISIANLARQQGRVGLAEELFAWAVAADPTNGSIKYQLGLTLALRGKAEDAYRMVEEGSRQSPDTWQILAHLSVLAERTRRPEVALESRLSALANSALPSEVWREIGKARLLGGDWRGAAAAFREVLALRQGDPSARRYLEQLRDRGLLDE